MSKIEVNTVDVQCGSTLTLGSSGKTVQIATGASTSGMGRTGTVDWETTPKTGNFTAENGKGYFCNTSGGGFTMTLPSSPSAGNIVALRDYSSNFTSNNLTIGRNSSKLQGTEADKVLSSNNTSLTLVYVDSTQGWIPTEEGTGNIGLSPEYVAASGGTVITCGNYKTHVFTSPATFTVSNAGNSLGSNTVDYLVVAGGGSGGFDGGGGGGAGGFRVSNSSGSGLPAPSMSPLITTTALPVSVQGYPIAVGGGGADKPGNGVADSGSVSTFSTITSAGGGGGSPGGAVNRPAGNGGSGGGTDRAGSGSPDVGSGNTPPVSPPQGQPGAYHPGAIGGGGGGAGGIGCTSGDGKGGIGSLLNTSFFGGSSGCYGTTGPATGRYFAGGGAGGTNPSAVPGAAKTGGSGGGGNVGNSGTANTGGGGGAGEASGPISQTGKAGGSGIVAIRYKYQT